MARDGYGSATPSRVAASAGVPIEFFYEHFKDVRACFFALYDDAVDDVSHAALDAAGGCSLNGGDWRAQLDSGVEAVLAFLAGNPVLTRSCVLEGPAMGREWLARRDGALERFIGYVEALGGVGGGLGSGLASELLVRGTYEVIYARVARGETERLPSLIEDLRYLWLLPYGQPPRPADAD